MNNKEEIVECKKTNIGISGDPIEKWKDDKLFPPEYILSLAEFILNCRTPMTISLQGEWGIGKTSFFNVVNNVLAYKENNESNESNEINENDELGNTKVTKHTEESILEQIVKRKKYPKKVLHIATINAWTYAQFEDSENLPLIILKALINKIKPNETTKFDVLYNIGSTIAKGITKKYTGAELTLSDIYNRDFFEKVESLKSEFNNIINSKIEEAKKDNPEIDRVLIFIDDLDRISPEKAVELLECFKNFLDVPNCVFVLAIDYDVIVKGACKKFGEEKGQAFFDKIIKLPFVLPVEHYNLREYLKNYIMNMFDEKQYFTSDDNIDLYLKIIENSIGNNPRAIGRVFNSFYTMYNMDKISYFNKELNARIDLPDSDPYEINITELFFYLCCVRTTHHKLFNYLLNDIEKIAGKDKNEVETYINEFMRDIDKHLDLIENVNDVKQFDDIEIKIERTLLELYCKILKDLNKLETLSPTTLYAIIVRERATGGHLNKL